MKRNLLILFLTAAVTFSCSSDSDTNTADPDETATPVEEVSPLVGIWDFTELDLNGANASAQLIIINGILDVLSGSGCDIATLTFNEDDTANIQVRDFSEQIAALEGGTTPSVMCPDAQVSEDSEWRLEGDQLTFVREGEEQTLTIVLDGDTLTIPAEIIEEEAFAGAGAVFTRRQ